MNEDFTEEQEYPLGTQRVDEMTGIPEVYVKHVAPPDGIEVTSTMTPNADMCEDHEVSVEVKPDPTTKILVLQIRDRFAKQYTCRTVDELGIFITNYKTKKNIKRDEDMAIELGFGWMMQSDYDKLPACEYFIKPH